MPGSRIWSNRDRLRQPAATKPILVAVATSGNALRAGVWTAAVLDALSKELPEFPRHVRFVTGASGGMVGAALFVASQVPLPTPGGSPPGPPGVSSLASRFSNDYLSPITGQLILA